MLVHVESELLSKLNNHAPNVPRGWIILACAVCAFLIFGAAFWIISSLIDLIG